MNNEILNQVYITSTDLKKLIPTLGINTCRKIIKDVAEEERKKGAYIPISKPCLAPTKAIRKKLKI